MTLLNWKRNTGPSAEHTGSHAEPSHESFQDLALPLLPALYNTARWLTRNPSDAEDLVQETVTKALAGFATFEAGTNFKAWVFRILRNTWLTSRSGLAARRTVALEDELDIAGTPEAAIDRSTPEATLLRLSDRAAIERALDDLSPPMLEVILLCDVEQMKYREIAAVLDVPIGTVMSRLARARSALRQSLAGLGLGEGGPAK